MKSGIELIGAERKRQVSEEGWTASHDDSHDKEELAAVAACYAIPPLTRRTSERYHHGFPKGCTTSIVDTLWPCDWDRKWWKPSSNDRIEDLVKSGALIAAEIDRILRRRAALTAP